VNAPAPSALEAAAQGFVARYAALKDTLAGDPARRASAAATFARLGLPGPREEAWRYTSLRPLADLALSAAPPAAGLALPGLDAPRLVFVNGRFDAARSRLPAGIRVTTGAPAFGTLADEAERMVALNTMLAEDGAAIDIPAGFDAGTLLLISLGTAGAFHPRHEVRLGAGARLTLVEIATGTGAYLHAPVLAAHVAEGASLTHLRQQQEGEGAIHLAAVFAEIAEGAIYDSFSLALGARLARADIHARLAGTRAMAHLNAAQLLGGTQHADFSTVVRHDAPATQSRQTVKNVLTGSARAVFQGRIEVARAAQKTDGYQMNQTLLLSRDAEIDSKPQLEIYADDVRCSHGATVGELDADQLFYLRSRGVPHAQARSMLVRAFLAEALDPIAHEAARAGMEAAISAWWDTHPHE
jgi:Fe-S cluster assembly protein SufD